MQMQIICIKNIVISELNCNKNMSTMKIMDGNQGGLRKTQSRERILSILKSSHYPLTSEEIYRKVGKFGINLSTVYRTVNSFCEAGLAKKEIGEGKNNVFSLVAEGDHHVLVCVRCHKKIELQGCPYQEANGSISKETGFQVIDHNTEIFGICPDCLKKEKGK